MDLQIQRTIQNLEKNNMVGFYIENIDDLVLLLQKLIPQGSSVGCGDSLTLEQTGVFDFLRSGNYVFYDKHKSGLTPEEKRSIYLQNFAADTFITGTNAVSEDGKLFNIDGNGSRVAPMLYGPAQVIVVVGRNKLTKTVEDAIERTRQIAAPLDALRLKKHTPCTKLNRCVDCKHEERICNDFVLITRQRVAGRIKVIIVNNDFGY